MKELPMYIKRRISVLGALVIFALTSAADGTDKTVLSIPMSDGVGLATNVYLPSTGDGPWPAVLTRTPYNKDKDLVPNLKFQDRGYAVVVQNVRGTGKSEGTWALFGNEGWGGPGKRDGVDTVAWIRAQPWSNGKVGAIGFSGSGIPAKLLVAAAPEGLVCAFVNASSDNLYETFFQNGCYRTNTADTWPQAEPMRPELRRHPAYDAFWKARNARSRCRKANVPVYVSGGWFDLFEHSTTGFFQCVNNNGLDRSNGHCKVSVMPVPHAAPPGQLTFPDRSKTNVDAAIGSMTEWFDHWLKGVDNGIEAKPAVALFIMGDAAQPEAPGNVVQLYDNWPPPSQPFKLYFQSNKQLSPVRPQAHKASAVYAYDPKNPVPTIGGNNLYPPSGPHDQREVEARPDVLTFTTDPLAQPVPVIGPVRITLYVSSDALDTDFSARLCDVYPDGRSMLMCEGILRGRFRKSLSRQTLMKPGRIYALDIDLWDTALVFAPGHSIRVDITSSNVPRYDPNPNTGEPILQHTHTVVANNTVYFDAKHPSCLILPRVASLKDGTVSP